MSTCQHSLIQGALRGMVLLHLSGKRMLRPLLMKWMDEILMDVKLQSIAQRDELIALLQGVVFPLHAVTGFVANAAVGALVGFLMKIKDHVLALAVLEKVHEEVEVAA